jgi:hypothetical protein
LKEYEKRQRSEPEQNGRERGEKRKRLQKDSGGSDLPALEKRERRVETEEKKKRENV